MMVSSVVDVEAATLDEAKELAYDSPDMPGSITIGAFGAASVDESGEWEITEIYQGDELVWKEGQD